MSIGFISTILCAVMLYFFLQSGGAKERLKGKGVILYRYLKSEKELDQKSKQELDSIISDILILLRGKFNLCSAISAENTKQTLLLNMLNADSEEKAVAIYNITLSL